MKHSLSLTYTFLLLCFAALAAGCSSPQKPSAAAPCADGPHLEERGGVTQLIVGGRPWLVLGCELGNSSSSSKDYMAPYWERLQTSGVNTVLAAVTWEQTEPEEGTYDFTVVDDLLEEARRYNLKLALLWFGSWKNGITSYDPVWVKSDTARFPLAQTIDGKKLPILSTLGEATCQADAKAFAALMQHLKACDAQEQTVVMVQMENEVGLHGYPRDYSPLANKAFEEPVPAALIDYLMSHKETLLPETLSAWQESGCRTEGTWEEVFGLGERAAEIFMAWHYAAYMDRISAEGKKQYDLPIFVNAWIVQPEDSHPGNYPSGGPQAQNHDIWRAAAPHIDMLCPDIYLNAFPEILAMYSRGGNPVFIPESRAGQKGAANAAYAIGQGQAIGYSPFGFESNCDAADNVTFCELYRSLSSIADKVLAAQASGTIGAAWLKGADPVQVKDDIVLGDVRLTCELVSSGMRNGGAPQLTGGTYNPDDAGYVVAIQEGDTLLVLGSNARVTFKPTEGDDIIGLAKVIEGTFDAQGNWKEGRWLNGDQIQLRYDLLYAVQEGYSGQGLNFQTPHPQFIKVQLFTY